MNLRAKQAEQTREAILDAAEELIFSDADPHAITMQAIADQAGVSHRTLYRYFETKGDLIDAMGRRMDGRLNLASNIEEPLDFETWTNGVEGMVRFGVLNREMLRRGLILGASSGEFRRDRDRRYWTLFRDRFPHLDEVTARQDFAALRHLHSAVNVVLVGERYDQSPEDLVAGIERAVQALVRDIDRRDRKARDV